MVRRLLSFLEREIRGLHEAAYLLAGFTFLSQVLALVRDRTFAHLFGAGTVLDVYFAAFRIPDLVFAFLTLFVSSFALVPLLSGKSKEEQGSFIGSILFLFGIGAVFGTVLVYICLPFLMPILIPGFSAEAQSHTLELARIMLLQPLLLGLSSIAASVVQASRKFVLFAIAPILYNVGIIAGSLFLYPIIGITGLAWGVVLGALMHLLIQSIPLVRARADVRLSIRIPALLATLQEVVVPSVPRAAALMSNQALLVAFASIASVVSIGAVSALSFGFNLQSVPLTVIGVSYAAALFPALAALAAKNDFQALAEEVWTCVRHLAFWLLPATAFFIVLRAHIVRVVLGSGAFSWDDTRLTAAILGLFAVSLFAQALILIFSRAYYALGKTFFPIVINVGGAICIGLSAYLLTGFVSDHPFLRTLVEVLFRVSDVQGTGVLMIPLSYSVITIMTAFVFAWAFSLTYGKGGVMGSLGTSFSASVIGAFGAYGTLQFFGPLLPTYTFLGIFAQGALAGLLGLTLWVIVLWLMKSQELNDVIALVRSRLVRAPLT